MFETFERVGTASATVKDFQRNGHLFPVRHPNGPNTDELQWKPLVVAQALHVLHNPRYTGTYVYGRRRERSRPGGARVRREVPRSEWIVVIPNSHPGYITWETYLANEQKIRQNGLAYGLDRRTRTPREGPALLQGIVLCGKCGRRMWVSYQRHGGGLTPIYMCYDDANKFTQRICQRVAGTTLDRALGQLLIDEMRPTAMALCLAVQDEVRDRADQSSSLRELHVKRAQYEVDLARMRYLQVDPTNRLVADTLEADWNEKLRALQVARDEHERGCAKDQNRVNDAERALVLGLPSGFAEMWSDSVTAHQVKKRIVRLLVDDVTLVRGEEVTMHVRLKGGVNRSLTLPVPLPYNDMRTTPVAVVELVDELLSEHTDGAVARELVRRGVKTGAGDEFSTESVKHLRYTYGLKCLRERLLQRGMLYQTEVARRLDAALETVRALRRSGVLEARVGDDKSTWMYDPGVVERVAEARRHKRPQPTAHVVESRGQGAV